MLFYILKHEGCLCLLYTSYGGPLFFTFFSFMGIDPHGLADMYGNDYEKQVFNQAKINYLYCIDNPKQYVGYGANCWGLSACNGNEGYVEFSPAKDYGVIAPYAAISAMPLSLIHILYSRDQWERHTFRR